jgi:hypothetical protein
VQRNVKPDLRKLSITTRQIEKQNNQSARNPVHDLCIMLCAAALSRADLVAARRTNSKTCFMYSLWDSAYLQFQKWVLNLFDNILIDHSIFHNQQKVIFGIRDQVYILQRVSIHQQKISERTFFYNANLTLIRTTFSCQAQQ